MLLTLIELNISFNLIYPLMFMSFKTSTRLHKSGINVFNVFVFLTVYDYNSIMISSLKINIF